MLLLLVTKLHGKMTYERMDCELARLPGHFAVRSQTEATIGDVSLDYKEIRLG